MEYVIAGLAGLAYGALCGALKYLFLWRPLLTGRRAMTTKTIYTAQSISMSVNVIILLAVYFLRNLWPYSFEVTIVAAAIALSLMGRLSPLRDMRKMEALSGCASETCQDDKEADKDSN